MTILEQRAYEAIIKMARKDEPDYWDKLKHQYAGMAMQGMVRTIGHDRMYPPDKIAIYAVACATALVEKLKNE